MPKTAKPETSISPLFVLLGGLALGLSFLPLPLFWLAWAALVPVLLLWDRVESVPRYVAEVYTSFLMAYAIAFFWPLLHVFEQVTPVAFGGLLAVPLLWTLPFVISLPFRRRRGRLIGLAVLITTFLSVETVLSHGPVPFPWPLLGNTQAGAIPFVQFAEFTGVAGLSLWVLVLNGLSFSAFVARRGQHRYLAGLGFLGLIVVSLGFSQWRRSQLTETARYVTVGLVQPAIEGRDWTARYGATRVFRLSSLSDSLIAAMNAPPVFMIWPEMALPAAGNEARQQFVNGQLQMWADRRQVALLTGALFSDGVPGKTRRFFNSAVLYRPYARPQRYDQLHRTPFLSAVPLKEQAPWFKDSLTPHFVPGAEQRTLAFDDIRIGVLLDFELLLGDYARRYPRLQAGFLVALSHEGWWGRTPVFGRQLDYPRLRAIETRRSVAQVTVSGNTALIAPDGSVIFQSDPMEQTARLAAMPLYEEVTLYARYGDWVGWSAFVLTLLVSAWLLVGTLWRLIRAPAPPVPQPAQS